MPTHKKTGLPRKARVSTKEAAAFEEYYTMGPGNRSLEKLEKLLTQKWSNDGGKRVHLSTLYEWSRTCNWQQRIIARDKEAIEKEKRKQDAALKKMNEAHATYGSAAVTLALKRINEILGSEKEKKNFGSLALVQLMKEGATLERLARGAATELTKVELTGEDGGPIQSQHLVQIYLPKKNEG